MNINNYSHAIHRQLASMRHSASVLELGTPGTCKRKRTICTLCIPTTHQSKDGHVLYGLWEFLSATNAPTHGHECTNEVGNCGCAHAETAAVLSYMNALNRSDPIVICTLFSPCTRCAQEIILARNLGAQFVAVAFDILTEHDQRGVELLKKAGIEVYCDSSR